MIVLQDGRDYRGKGTAVALGMFDGVHIGHQALLRTAVQLAGSYGLQSAVCTFDVNPLSVLCPEKAPKPIYTLEENLKKFACMGIEVALVHPFTREFAAMLPEDYIAMLTEELRAKFIISGENYTFGRMGRGNMQMLQELSGKYGYTARIVPPVCDREGVVSSTRIRAMLARNDEHRAHELLDIPYSVKGRS